MEKNTSIPIYAIQGLGYILASGFGLLSSSSSKYEQLPYILFIISILSAIFYLCRLAGQANLKFPDPDEKICHILSAVSIYSLILGYLMILSLKATSTI